MDETRMPMDVWLKFGDIEIGDNNEELLTEYEANTFRAGSEFVVEWYHNAVGQVSREWFATYRGATAWLEDNGFQDFSS